MTGDRRKRWLALNYTSLPLEAVNDTVCAARTKEQQVEMKRVTTSTHLYSSVILLARPHFQALRQLPSVIHVVIVLQGHKNTARATSIHSSFTSKCGTDVLLFCSLTTLKTQRTTNHQYTVQYPKWLSVCDLKCLSPPIVQGEFALKCIWSHCALQHFIVF